MKKIATIHTDLKTKFGVPRQAGLVPGLTGRIVFEPEYRNPDAVRGLEQFSHIWLIWEFSENIREGFSPTVRPPRLGGNERLGVFATRSPFRPNPIGLSCVELLRVETDSPDAPALIVSGADMMDGTPIYDIKPYLPYADSRPGARGGFTDSSQFHTLDVELPPELGELLPPEKAQALISLLSQDPRPQYHNDPGRVYGFEFAGFEIKFTVSGSTATVVEISPE
ncbi:MAG: tRNA (N6-threonylcarbamoyladenosine(37)-N6)-methyltransferase TrmO [Lachnospiraceae bacterium]|nr:tRNA (N6-threonylcarbamoyladenosine(37)-N6)-methyltransferase TrmO [Lachnospiraceae bacterium]